MSRNVVLPWCRCPHTATLRMRGGQFISVAMNSVEYCSSDTPQRERPTGAASGDHATRLTVVEGTVFSSTEKTLFLMGAMIGSVSGCVSSSWTSVSASGYTSSASG